MDFVNQMIAISNTTKWMVGEGRLGHVPLRGHRQIRQVKALAEYQKDLCGD